MNTGDLLEFRLEVCDYRTPGVQVDKLGIRVGRQTVSQGMSYSRYDNLSDEDVVKDALRIGNVTG